MKRPMTIVMVLLALLSAPVSARTGPGAAPGGPATLAELVDMDAFARMAVYSDGRIKSFESFASTMMRVVSGANRIDGQSPAFTYLDLMFRPFAYEGREVIYVKKKPMRAQIVEVLRRDVGAAPDPELNGAIDRFMETGLISADLLERREVQELMESWSRDLIRTAKFAGRIESALAVRDPRVLLNQLRIVPPADGDVEQPWFSLRDVVGSTDPAAQLNGMTAAQHRTIVESWRRLMNAWSAGAELMTVEEQAAEINVAAHALASQLAAISPGLYPVENRLLWEAWYFRAYNLTWIWVFYALCAVPLLLHIVFRWRAARWIGLAMFIGTFALHTFAMGLRWYVAERFPNSNMFEAVTTSVWFGGVAALILEIIVRRTPMQSIFALGSAVSSMVALMCAYYMPLSLDAGIENRMPVLHDVWLYIHTNVIIFSYCLIFMAAITALLYLLYRGAGLFGGFGGPGDFARVGGAGSLIVTGPDGSKPLTQARGGFGQVLDGTTMVLMELSFIMLWAGLVMGAIWADHSWGRPWGWDPKEVFALNTFIVFAVLVHCRIKVRDKGLWTACIALFGAAVMLFNWIVINFVISGLHSYA